MSVGAVILAAGFSRRLGRPKQEEVLAGETLLTRTVRIAREAKLAPVVAVVRESHWCALLEPLGAEVVINPRAEEGMSTSVVAGVGYASQKQLTGLVLLTCDQPALRTVHLAALCAQPLQITASFYAGRRGVPAYFPAGSFGDLLALQGDAGARQLLQRAPFVTDEALALDIDTEQDLAAAQRIMPSL